MGDGSICGCSADSASAIIGGALEVFICLGLVVTDNRNFYGHLFYVLRECVFLH